jgi:hypothetical protein
MCAVTQRCDCGLRRRGEKRRGRQRDWPDPNGSVQSNGPDPNGFVLLKESPNEFLRGPQPIFRPARVSKGSSTLNIEDQTVIYALQQRHLNGPLNLEDAAGFSIYRVSLNNTLSI